MMLSVAVLFVLVLGCSGVIAKQAVISQHTSSGSHRSVDAVSMADPGTGGATEGDQTVLIMDLSGATTTPDQEEALLREHTRTQMETKLLCCRECEGAQWELLDFDCTCKQGVSESKVRQGIFHFRLQSDDEEAPSPRMKLAA